MMKTAKVPCPHCVFRGPVWLDENRKCVYCKEVQPAHLDEWIWRAVPWEWWLEEGMISEDRIPTAVAAGKVEEEKKLR